VFDVFMLLLHAGIEWQFCSSGRHTHTFLLPSLLSTISRILERRRRLLVNRILALATIQMKGMLEWITLWFMEQ
jgi:hypothetical protein